MSDFKTSFDSRQERIRQSVERFLGQDRAPSSQSCNAFFQQHSDLMPELAEELRRLQIVLAARRQANEPNEKHVEITATSDWALRVRCPSCGQLIEVLSQNPLTAVSCNSCGSSFSLLADKPTPEPVPKKVLGHFTLIERIGLGAFGAVWKAQDTDLDRVVAVKIPRFADLDPFEMEKFLREARSAAQLRHPQIVTVHEIGREGDTLYIISEFIEGMPLAGWLREKRPTHREAASLCKTIAHAIHHAHEIGVVHRDLKPANILIDSAGGPHITDFGLAKRESGEVTLTVDGEIIGTPAYLSPEQARGDSHACDRRSDVYSLGAILFELLTGELPFRGTIRTLLFQVINDDPPSPKKLDRTVPRDLETICLKCLEKDPARRYQSAQELAAELGRWLEHRPIRAKPASSLYKLHKWCRRNPLPAVSICLLGTLFLAGALYWQTRPAYLDLRVSPSNAIASLNGEKIQLFEGRALFATKPGAFQLAVSAPEHVAERRQINLTRGRANALPVTIELEAQFGFAVIETVPSGGRITLTNSQTEVVAEGTTPFHSSRLPSGTYKVQINKELYRNAGLSVSIPTGDRVSKPPTIQLAPAVEGTETSHMLADYRKAMNREVEVDFRGKRLRDAIDELSKQTGLLIQFENDSTSRMFGGSMLNFHGRTQLRNLRDHFLSGSVTWIPAGHVGSQLVLDLVTPDEVRARPVRVLHPIHDLIDAENDPQASAIIRSIMQIGPDTWSRVGGPGTVSFVPSVKALAVQQWWNVQYAIDEHLMELRRSKADADRFGAEPAKLIDRSSAAKATKQSVGHNLSAIPEFQVASRAIRSGKLPRSVSGTLRACVMMASASRFPDLGQIADLILASSSQLVSAEQQELLSEAALNVGYRCQSLGHFDYSTKLARLAAQAAEACQRADLAYQATMLKDHSARKATMCDTLDGFNRSFFIATDQSPPSPSLARFLCFVQEDWQSGTTMLAQARDSDLQSVAEAEQEAPADSTKQLALADKWWQLSDSLANPELVSSYRQRAKYWYLKALGSIDPAARASLADRVLKRIDSLSHRPVTLRIRALGVEDKQTIRITNDGVTMVSSHGTRAVQINHLSQTNLAPSLTQFSPNNGGTQLTPHTIDFSTADVRRILNGQDSQLSYNITPDHFQIELERAPSGTGDFEVCVTFESNGLSLPNRFSGLWDVQWFVWDPGNTESAPPQWELAERATLDHLDFQCGRHPNLTTKHPPSAVLAKRGDRGTHFSMNANTEWNLPAGDYEVHTIYDDGIRVTIDGTIVIDDWKAYRGNVCRGTKTEKLELTEGKHKIRVDYLEETGNGNLKFSLRRLDQQMSSADVRPNYALSFFGDRQIQTWERFTAPDPLTLEAWILPHNTQLKENGWQIIVGDVTPRGVSLGLASVNGRTHWQFNLHQGRNSHWVRSDEPAIVRKEVHLAGVCENGEVRLYVDGKLQGGRAQINGDVETSAYPLMFRAQPDGLAQFRGTVDEIRYSRIARYRDAFVPDRRLRSDENAVFLFSLDEGVGEFLLDAANERTMGTIKGAYWSRPSAR